MIHKRKRVREALVNVVGKWSLAPVSGSKLNGRIQAFDNAGASLFLPDEGNCTVEMRL